MKKQFNVDFAGSSYPAFYLDNRTDAEAAIRKMSESRELLIADCETAALPEYKHIPDAPFSPHLARPRLFQMFTGKAAVVIDLFKTGELPTLGKLFEERPSVFHSMTFDLKMLMKWHGVKHPDMHCTAIMARCCWQAMYPGFKSVKLGDVAFALFNEHVIKKAGASDWSVSELTFEQVKYAASDVVILSEIHKKLKDMMTRLKLNTRYEVFRKAQIVISGMELAGISFDKETHKLNIVKWRQEMADAKDEVESITGIKVITDQKISDWLKERLSPEVLSIWPLTDKTATEEHIKNKTYRLAVGADALVDFSHLPLVKPFSRFQKYKKLCTGFGTNLLEQINPATGKIHAGYTVVGARTGRVSCSNPNFLNQPRDKDMRRVYTASPGKIMIGADYGQLEVRLIAEFSKEERMLQAFENGTDIYSFTIAGLLDISIEQVSKDQRQSGKCIVLGRSYGLGRVKQAHYAKKNYGKTFTESENDSYFYGYRKLYPDLYAWQLEQANKCEANRYTCFEPLGKVNKLSENSFFGASMNMPVQGAAASIMDLALIGIEKKIRNTSCQLLGTIYDEVIAECNPEDEEFVKETLTEEMTKWYSKLVPNARTLKNLVSPTSGRNWSEAKG